MRTTRKRDDFDSIPVLDYHGLNLMVDFLVKQDGTYEPLCATDDEGNVYEPSADLVRVALGKIEA